MVARLRSLIEWSQTREGKKLTRYLFGSVWTTAVSLIWIAFFYGLKIIPGVIWATLSGNLVVVIPSYYWNRALAWGKRGRSHFRNEIVPYWTMALLGISFSELGAFWARGIVHSHNWSHLVNTGLVAGVNLLCFAIFFVLKLMVFNKIFHVAHHVETAEEPVAVQEGTSI
jgi:hypothetical protein